MISVPPSFDHFFADHSLSSQCLPNCAPLSFGFVVDKLARHWHCFGQLFECGHRIFGANAVELSGTNGFTSRVLRCEFEFEAVGGERRTEKKKMSVIAKVVSLERMDTLMENFVGKEHMEKMRNGTEQRSEVVARIFMHYHRSECHFYELVGSSPPLPLPKVFYTQLFDDGEGEAKGVGLIFMEDLSESTHLESFEQGLTVEKTGTVIRHLAQFHAKMWARSDWQEHFVDANELFDEQQRDNEGGGGHGEFLGAMHAQMLEFNKEVAAGQQKRCHPEKFEVLLNRMRRLFTSMDFAKWTKRKCQEELGVEETLIHNDLWMNNILWHNGQREGEVAAFIDWQLASRGNPMVDVARLLLMNTSPEVRRELERDGHILKQYLEVLRTEGGHFQFGLEQLSKAYKLAMVGQTLGCVMVLPFFQRVWANEANCEAKNAKLMERAVAALGDAVKVLEEEAPEWLEEATEEETEG